jgi:hypothetical protein
MATPKTITINDIKIGKISLQLSNDGLTLYAEGVYRYIDENSTEIEQLDPSRVQRSILWENLPQNIKDSLILINTFLYQQALIDEGME